MALTNQQVQQVFLAIAGRPAEGSAAAWGASALSVSALANMVVDIRKGADFANSKETFVENLYTQLLGRASDTEGKEFWLEALNNGASYGDVLAQFINAVLAQPSSADLYTLQNKLSIAEKISAQVNTFQGGAAAEATLKALMEGVNANTTIDSIQDSVAAFKAQNVDVTSVTLNQNAEEEVKGSEEHATSYNATLDYNKDGSDFKLTGSNSFNDSVKLSIKGEKENGTASVDLGSIGLDRVASIDVSVDTKVDSIVATAGGKLSTLTISGKSADVITVKGAATVKTGAGIDNINVSAAVGKTVTVDGGAGKDTVVLGTATTNDFTKLSLTSVEALSGKGTLSYATLNRSKFELANNTELAVKAESGIDLGKVTAAEGATSAKIAINGVKSGTVKLSANDAGIAETITTGLIKAGSKLTINNLKSTEDVLVLKDAGLNFAGAWQASVTASSSTLLKLDDISKSAIEKNADVLKLNSGEATTIFAQDKDSGQINVYNIAVATVSGSKVATATQTLTLVGLPTDVVSGDITIA